MPGNEFIDPPFVPAHVLLAGSFDRVYRRMGFIILFAVLRPAPHLPRGHALSEFAETLPTLKSRDYITKVYSRVEAVGFRARI
jgi:hypothetical protein